MSGRILFYVQHLMGVGHVFRAMRIAAELAKSGHLVDLVYGGEPVPNFNAGGASVHYLPPLRAGASNFNDLEDGSGQLASEAYKAARRDLLLQILADGRHDLIITEAFPFGRRQMRFELIPLLDAARARSNPPMVVCSVRDILQENRKPGRDRETADTLRDRFDHVLVHGDPDMVEFGETFPLFERISDMVTYTGIVAPQRPEPLREGDDHFDVVVSAGGGALGRELLFAAVGAKPLSPLSHARWCVVTGVNFSERDRTALEELADREMEIRTFLPNLCATLTEAKLSISRCGYNTAADIFVSGCRAIVVPLSDGTETEQLRRAEIMHRKGIAIRVDPAEQTPEHLASAVKQAMAMPDPAPKLPDLNGAEKTANIVSKLLAMRR